uniref:Transcription initiation factor IIA subunit 2 n=1 Tax=Timspurckia oligopyrenoides TaxID=708627 RepID=A0A7S0ZDF9_9RHOD|mmetsp:Transcript_13495/g.24204  ORF Transcript_13495/g.24204 Transcript_13495/m.24204 type:complete len:117 (+) Transcript_13495:169-519(+)|eukprot:CAMPEP_0182446276 /NCGR_PEP_ID=MMETSP1172-20130603/4105_1 /TAXON_ID=708627 /ORGANISM="Timspurckia oligopyrenoides, Strain CCMP3278" /LENGTH=116 /DNA_ID=CAMNT_0024642187 /DNA_START=166 /DNA_END=516 /DNA_ORIENTATION=+
MSYYQHYRVSTVGIQLEDSLEDMLDSETLTEEQAEIIRNQFDKAISAALASQVKNKATLKGKLHHYRNCDNVWTFFLDSASIKIDANGENHIVDDKLKIIACDGRAAGTNTAKKKS